MAGVAASASDDSAVAAIPSPGAAGAPGAAEGGNAVTVPPTSEDNLVTLALRWYANNRACAARHGLSAREARDLKLAADIGDGAAPRSRSASRLSSAELRELPPEEGDLDAYVDASVALAEARGIESVPLRVEFKDICFKVKHREDPTKEVVLLHPASGVLEPGSLIAVMGPSGCGKTTLVDCISGKKTAPYEGTVLVNGGEVGTTLSRGHWSRLQSYVPQQDYGHPLSTVREEVEFVTRLRSDFYSRIAAQSGALGEELRRRDIAALLNAVGLAKVADTRVGGALVRGISGGQRRRLTLCKGIMADPAIIFMDEPTSGLSASDSEKVIRVCRKGCDAFKLTICVILHQPKQSTFELFDTLFLMVDGKMAYAGPRAGAVAHVESALGHAMPAAVNPADWLLDMVTDDVDGADKDAVVDAFEKTKAAATAEIAGDLGNCEEAAATGGGDDKGSEAPPARLQMASASKAQLEVRPIEDLVEEREAQLKARACCGGHGGFWYQLKMLLARDLRLLFRNWAELVVVVSNGLFLGFLIGAIFLSIRNKTGPDETAAAFIQYQISFLYISITTGALLSFANLPQLINDRVVYLNEHAEGLYSAAPYMLSKLVVRTITGQAGVFIFAITSFMMAGFSGTLFPFFWLALAVAYFSLDGIMAAIATVSASHEVANTLASAVLTIVFLFNGFTANAQSSPDWIIWIQYTSAAFYAFIAVATEAFENYAGYPWDCFAEREQQAFPDLCLDDDGVTVVPNGVQNIYDIKAYLKWWSIGIMALFGVTFNLAAVLAQRYLVKLDK